MRWAEAPLTANLGPPRRDELVLRTLQLKDVVEAIDAFEFEVQGAD